MKTEVIEIGITSNYRMGRWFYDPVGVYVEPGQKIRWVGRKWGGSVTAFHPSNDNHELRIPESAKPFDSGILIQGDAPAARFEWVFEEEGTYDYFSLHHERLGAVRANCGRFARWSRGTTARVRATRRKSSDFCGCRKVAFLVDPRKDRSRKNCVLSHGFA